MWRGNVLQAFISKTAWRRHQMETFPRYWTFMRWIPTWKAVTRSFDVSLICAITNSLANDRDTGDLICHCTQYDVTVMVIVTGMCWCIAYRSFWHSLVPTTPTPHTPTITTTTTINPLLYIPIKPYIMVSDMFMNIDSWHAMILIRVAISFVYRVYHKLQTKTAHWTIFDGLTKLHTATKIGFTNSGKFQWETGLSTETVPQYTHLVRGDGIYTSSKNTAFD